MDIKYEDYNDIISNIIKRAKEYNFKPEIIDNIKAHAENGVSNIGLITRLTQCLANDLYHEYIYCSMRDIDEETKEKMCHRSSIHPLLNGEKHDVAYYVQLITDVILPRMSQIEGNIAFNETVDEEEGFDAFEEADTVDDKPVEQPDEEIEVDEEYELLDLIRKHCESKELNIDTDDIYSYMNGPTSALLSIIDHPSEKDANEPKIPYAGISMRQQVNNIITSLQQVIVANSTHPDKKIAKHCYQYTMRLNDIITYNDRMDVTPKTLIYRAFYGVIYYFPSELASNDNLRLKCIRELEKTIRWYKDIDVWLNVLHENVVNRIAKAINTKLQK